MFPLHHTPKCDPLTKQREGTECKIVFAEEKALSVFSAKYELSKCFVSEDLNSNWKDLKKRLCSKVSKRW